MQQILVEFVPGTVLGAGDIHWDIGINPFPQGAYIQVAGGKTINIRQYMSTEHVRRWFMENPVVKQLLF